MLAVIIHCLWQLNANIRCIWSSQCLENVWTILICFVMYVENLQWKTKDRITPRIKKAYKLYFCCKFWDEDKPWAPHICWGTCASKLRKWLQNSRQSFPSAWYFVRPAQAVTCGTVAIIIWVVFLSPYLCIRGVPLSSIHYNQSHRVYFKWKQQYICLICN